MIDTLFGTDDNNQPTNQGAVPVQAKAPVVSLTITNLTITSVNKRDKSANSTFEADVQYEFDVQWTSSLAAAQPDIYSCNTRSTSRRSWSLSCHSAARMWSST